MRAQNVCRLTAAALLGAVLACEEDQIAFQLPAGDVEEFQATLASANEVPAVTSAATGGATFGVVLDTFLVFALNVTAIDSPTVAHIHRGAAGVNGEVDTLVILYGGPTRGRGVSGLLAGSQLKPSQLTRLPTGYGATARARFDSLLSLMRAGNAYVHVHTRANRDGEIRGQVQTR